MVSFRLATTRLVIFVPLVLLVALSSAGKAASYLPSLVVPPKPAREYRAAWVASVANIDWPSQKGLTTGEQKAELKSILDRAAQLKLNTIILQVRPSCDALYASQLEPWSEYLTGTMGRAPEPFYDPLAFAVEEAHKRGLELHAWFNPYRAGHPSGKGSPSANHISRTRPQLVRHYGKQLWLDPGEREVQDYSLSVVMDVVKRYDIDGVHFDDYFYPYKEQSASGQELDFPDNASWQKSGAGGGLSRDDWRRQNVNTFIERTYKSIKAAKPWVKFGLSPFGIWRPENPPRIKGFDAYEKLYADSRKWLMNGWLDYFVPQLYWSIDSREQSFPALLRWWTEQNPKGRHVLPGMDDTKILGNKWTPEEIINQIRLTRKQRGTSGHVHWNMKSLMRSEPLDQALEKNVYSEAALVPAAGWLDNSRPDRPTMTIEKTDAGKGIRMSWTYGGIEKPSLWILQTRSVTGWKTEILPRWKTSHEIKGNEPDAVAVSAIDRNGNASAPVVLELRR